MTDYDFPQVPEIEKAYRAAHHALEGIIPRNLATFTPEADLHVTEVLSQFSFMVEHAEMAVAGQLGPRIHWEAPRRDGDWDLIASGADLDDGGRDFGVTLSDSAVEGDGGEWEGSSLSQAARAYRRACGWDFPPGHAGVWLLMLAPVSGGGGGDKDSTWFYSGHVAGFVILYDRDEDGGYEAVGHIWTASAWRRRGIARRLLQEARSRFGARSIEGPYTEDGAAFVRACGEGSE